MFPLKSGLSSGLTPDMSQVMYQCLAASAMHEIGQQAILDASLLMFHQQAADVYYREDQGIPITTNEDGSYELYTPKEREQIRKDLINVIMKYHILDDAGMAAKLTPLIDHLHSQEPLTPETAADPLTPETAADPFIQRVLAGHRQYSQALFSGNIQQTLAQIMNFTLLENISEEASIQVILSSYKEPDDMVDVAVYEDGTVQCACEFCEGFFQILETEADIERASLNPIQQIMDQNYNF